GVADGNRRDRLAARADGIHHGLRQRRPDAHLGSHPRAVRSQEGPRHRAALRIKGAAFVHTVGTTWSEAYDGEEKDQKTYRRRIRTVHQAPFAALTCDG